MKMVEKNLKSDILATQPTLPYIFKNYKTYNSRALIQSLETTADLFNVLCAIRVTILFSKPASPTDSKHFVRYVTYTLYMYHIPYYTQSHIINLASLLFLILCFYIIPLFFFFSLLKNKIMRNCNLELRLVTPSCDEHTVGQDICQRQSM